MCCIKLLEMAGPAGSVGAPRCPLALVLPARAEPLRDSPLPRPPRRGPCSKSARGDTQSVGWQPNVRHPRASLPCSRTRCAPAPSPVPWPCRVPWARRPPSCCCPSCRAPCGCGTGAAQQGAGGRATVACPPAARRCWPARTAATRPPAAAAVLPPPERSLSPQRRCGVARTVGWEAAERARGTPLWQEQQQAWSRQGGCRRWRQEEEQLPRPAAPLPAQPADPRAQPRQAACGSRRAAPTRCLPQGARRAANPAR